MNAIVKKFYDGRGYVYTGAIFCLIYVLIRGYFDPAIIATAMIMGAVLCLPYAYFHDYFDKQIPKNEEFINNPKNWIKPILIATTVVITGFAIHYIYFV